MRITTAWVWDEHDSAPGLVSAYDELTEDIWQGTPEFFTEEIAKTDGEIRIVDIEVDSNAIYALFKSDAIEGRVLPSD